MINSILLITIETIIMAKAKLIEIPKRIFNPRNIGVDPRDTDIVSDIQTINALNSNPNVQKFLASEGIRRGDVVHLEAADNYRNTGKYIYDGYRIINLNYDYDEYGAVPNEFKVIDEFPIHYWTSVIAHNGIVHFNSDPYVDEILDHLEKIDANDIEIYKSIFTHANGTSYTTFFIYEDGPEGEEKIHDDLQSHVFDAFDDMGCEEIGDYDPDTTLFRSVFSGNVR